MRSGSELAETQRAQVVSPDVLQPLEKEVEISIVRRRGLIDEFAPVG